MADYYEILGVPRDASSDQVRQAYLRLAKERHPDRFSDPAEKERAQEFFKELTAAFNTLSTDRSRREYDAELQRPREAPPAEIAKVAYQRAVKKFEERDYHEAITLLRTAVQHAPEEARYHAALARALAKNPHWIREAIQTLEAAVRLAPRNGRFRGELAGLLHAQGLRIRARREAEVALDLAPDDPDVQRIAAELAPPKPEPEPEGGGLLGRLRKKAGGGGA